uniref:Uncharacterized protein n=1 Tax=Arion vulgaris TaxID=1028688 RepID=A0A0B7AQG9_9EUPU
MGTFSDMTDENLLGMEGRQQESKGKMEVQFGGKHQNVDRKKRSGRVHPQRT